MLDVKTIKLCADILIECGYAKQYPPPDSPIDIRMKLDNRWKRAFIVMTNGSIVRIAPFRDFYQGHIQAFALEDWLVANHKKLWLLSMNEFGFDDRSKHQWRLDRAEWCLNELAEGE